MENEEVSFVAFLATLDQEYFLDHFLDSVGLDDNPYQEYLIYYVY